MDTQSSQQMARLSWEIVLRLDQLHLKNKIALALKYETFSHIEHRCLSTKSMTEVITSDHLEGCWRDSD